MGYFYRGFRCIECSSNISIDEKKYSIYHFHHPLCRNCQDRLRYIFEHSSASNESIELYFALKRRYIRAELEKYDGYKTIDIAVPECKVNIEVDGEHHNFDAEQANRDLDRTLYSFEKGYLTLRIPNSLVQNYLEETADKISAYLQMSKNMGLGNDYW
jgi:very-short-patch-repair endonuclease